MTAISDLITRLQNGSGPDRDLDGEICVALTHISDHLAKECDMRGAFPYAHPCGFVSAGAYGICEPAYPLTSSIDACIALFDRVLPGVDRESFIVGKSREYGINIYRNFDFYGPWRNKLATGQHDADEPRAFLIAILRAVATKEKA
jgi:hypothetical protein